MSGLAYPNGVAVSEDRTHTSVSRSPDRVGCSGTGPKQAGTAESFTDLPGQR
jgi:hypothetical protein